MSEIESIIDALREEERREARLAPPADDDRPTRAELEDDEHRARHAKSRPNPDRE